MQHIPMYHKFLLLVAFLPVAAGLQAQADKAIRLIEGDKFDGVESMLRAAVGDEKERPLAYFGLALLFADTDYGAYQLDSAYQNIEAANLAYRALDYKAKGKISKDLTSSQISRLRTAILKAALKKANTEDTEASYQYFIDHYPNSGSRYEGKAMDARNQIVFDAAKAQNTEEAYNQLLDKYGDDMKANTRNLYDAAQKRQFELFLDNHGWAGYHDFADKYPDNIYVRDSMYESFHDLWFGPVRDYYDFIQANPDVPITKYAIDSLGMRLTEEADSLLSPQFLEQFPHHPTWKAVYGTWYESIKHRFRNMGDLERFKTAHPDFPFPERYVRDAEVFLDRSYEKLEVGKALGAFRAFIDRNPTYSKIDSVWMRYYKTFKMQLPGAENLDRFIKANPDFPFPELIEADKRALQKGAEDGAWLRLKSSGSMPDLFRYLKAKPDSPYWEAARDLLARRLVEEGREPAINGFLKDYPDHPLRPALKKNSGICFRVKTTPRPSPVL